MRLWPFTVKDRRPRLPAQWALSSPLLRWSKTDAWTLRDAVEGTIAFGATGSGKSSGSGRAMATAMLRAGFGGLVLTAKADERKLWESYCRETGRLDDLVIFGPEESFRFNFLDFELSRTGAGAGLTENIVNALSTVLEVAERNSAAGGGREDEGYWRRANRQMVRNLVDLLALANGRVSVPELYALIISAPTSHDQMRSEEWRKNSLCWQCLAEAEKKEKTPRQQADFGMVADYFVIEYPNLSEKTRSVVVSTFTSMVDVINRGLLSELFCGETNITPEAVEQGKIVLVDLPVKEFAEVGQFANVLWKTAFQRSIERRDIGQSPRPVFLWADEAQHFVTSRDAMFQATCRSARVATVLLTQNVSGFYAALGGQDKGKAEATALFGNLNTRIFHANGDAVTNEFAATMIGRSLQTFASGNTSYPPEESLLAMAGITPPGQTSAGFHESYEFEVQPSAFTQLRTGGPDNGYLVDAIVVQNGKRFRGTGRTWLPVTFEQKHEGGRRRGRREAIVRSA